MPAAYIELEDNDSNEKQLMGLYTHLHKTMSY